MPADAQANLFAPAPGPHGAHGRFYSQAKRMSWTLFRQPPPDGFGQRSRTDDCGPAKLIGAVERGLNSH